MMNKGWRRSSLRFLRLKRHWTHASPCVCQRPLGFWRRGRGGFGILAPAQCRKSKASFARTSTSTNTRRRRKRSIGSWLWRRSKRICWRHPRRRRRRSQDHGMFERCAHGSWLVTPPWRAIRRRRRSWVDVSQYSPFMISHSGVNHLATPTGTDEDALEAELPPGPAQAQAAASIPGDYMVE